MTPQVSIVILNYNYPHNIERCLPSIQLTRDVVFETIVVDNGSEPESVEILKRYKAEGMIDTLVLEPVNHYFSEGCNIGVRHSQPNSEFVLLLNSDTEIIHGDWLRCMIEWAEGIPEVFFPYPWTTCPTQPKDIRRGIVSIDWGHDTAVPGCVRPEGWCCLIRREAWREMSPDFPMCQGDMEMMASAIRDGHPCGVLSQYGKYIKHYHGGSHEPNKPYKMMAMSRSVRQPEPEVWWDGLECESLDFTLGPHETESFMCWSRGLEAHYREACDTPTDINEHLPALFDLACECSHIVEAGVRYVVSSWAFLWGCACRGGEVHSYCWTKIPEIQRAIDICKDEGVQWTFTDGDWLTRDVPETDLLFIDTNHTYTQLSEELRTHGPKARKYIVLHDTETFKTIGADGKTPGLGQAIEEFIADSGWRIKDHYENCNGLTVLEKAH